MNFLFGDISGSEDGEAMVAAAYYGTNSQWDTACGFWASLLKEVGVDAFHATDFYSCKEAFGHIELNCPQHIELAKKFTAVADDAGLIGFAWGCEPKPFIQTVVPVMQKEYRVTTSDLRISAVMNILLIAEPIILRNRLASADGVRVGFENEKASTRFEAFFKESKGRREPWTDLYLDFTSPPKDWMPVQMADLLAHECWRWAKEQLKTDRRKMRLSFKRMLQSKHVENKWLDAENMPEAARLIAATVASDKALVDSGRVPDPRPRDRRR